MQADRSPSGQRPRRLPFLSQTTVPRRCEAIVNGGGQTTNSLQTAAMYWSSLYRQAAPLSPPFFGAACFFCLRGFCSFLKKGTEKLFKRPTHSCGPEFFKHRAGPLAFVRPGRAVQGAFISSRERVISKRKPDLRKMQSLLGVTE